MIFFFSIYNIARALTDSANSSNLNSVDESENLYFDHAVVTYKTRITSHLERRVLALLWMEFRGSTGNFRTVNLKKISETVGVGIGGLRVLLRDLVEKKMIKLPNPDPLFAKDGSFTSMEIGPGSELVRLTDEGVFAEDEKFEIILRGIQNKQWEFMYDDWKAWNAIPYLSISFYCKDSRTETANPASVVSSGSLDNNESQECQLASPSLEVKEEDNLELMDEDAIFEDTMEWIVIPESDHLSSKRVDETRLKTLLEKLTEDSLCILEHELKQAPDDPFSKAWFSPSIHNLSEKSRASFGNALYNFMTSGLNANSRGSVSSELLDNGLLISIPEFKSDSDSEPSRYLPSPQMVKAFFGEKGLRDFGFMNDLTEIIHPDNIVPKTLYYSSDISRDLDEIRHVCSQEHFTKISERFAEKGKRASLTFMLYGGPGTGKTEIVKQIAKESGRDIIIADYTRLQSSFVGESPKLYKQLFIGYKYMCAMCPTTPILLFNEADSFMNKRVSITRSYDKEENGIQNLILQEMENFEGILIATTNCEGEMDNAFDRRFLKKLKIGRPDADARVKIWESLADDTIPNTAIPALARDYELSGANIENIVTRLDLHYIIYGERPDIRRINEECKNEMVANRIEAGNVRRRVGFIQ